jgi:hypothetical protein
MPCPFPGMDTYIERPEIWPDFHSGLIIMLRSALLPLLRPRYVALTEDRLYVVEADRPVRPDLSIVRTSSPARPARSGPAVLEPDAPVVFEIVTETIRESVLHIIEPAAGNRVVTAIEVLSPGNKAAGPGRDAYLQKRDELWEGGSNFVEIDLLRHGTTTIRVSAERLETLRPWHYLVAVSRQKPPRQEVYHVPLQHRLSRIRVPLAADDEDVTVDLQAVFTRSWDEGPYPEVLRYDGPPPGTMTAEEFAWCENLLREAGYRPPQGANGNG